MFLEWWNTTWSLATFDNFFSRILDYGIKELQRKFNHHNEFWEQTKTWKKIAVWWTELAAPCRLLKKPSWDFNFLHTFCTLDVFWGQQIKQNQVASTSELLENQRNDLVFFKINPLHFCRASEASNMDCFKT